jgi:hypothetical protein
MWQPVTSLEWQSRGVCAQASNRKFMEEFFSSEFLERYDAKNMCFSCPVRSTCLQWALEHRQIWGIWGGNDETEIRRALSVSFNGEETKRHRPPHCPFCAARPGKLTVTVENVPGGGRWKVAKVVNCSACGFSWRSRTSANAVEMYHAERKEQQERAALAEQHSQETSRCMDQVAAMQQATAS